MMAFFAFIMEPSKVEATSAMTEKFEFLYYRPGYKLLYNPKKESVLFNEQNFNKKFYILVGKDSNKTEKMLKFLEKYKIDTDIVSADAISPEWIAVAEKNIIGGEKCLEVIECYIGIHAQERIASHYKKAEREKGLVGMLISALI